MRFSLVLVALLAACGSSGAGSGGGSGGGAGGGGAGGGAGGGTAGEQPMPCTPAGFMTAPPLVNLLPLPGITAANEHSAYARFVVKDGGRESSVELTVSDFGSDGGPNVPAVSARVNGCDLGGFFLTPGVGKTFRASDAGVWVPTAGRYLSFEVVSAAGTLLYRNVIPTPQVLPKITAVTNAAGPTAKVDFAPMPDAGITKAYIFGWKRLGGSGLQSLGLTNIDPNSGTANVNVSQAAQLFELQTESGGGISAVRLTSAWDVP